MRLPHDGREYAHADVTGLAADVMLEASLDGDTWTPMTRAGDTVRLLVAGPDTASNPAGTVVLPRGRSTLAVRVEDTPEIIVRAWGPFDVLPS